MQNKKLTLSLETVFMAVFAYVLSIVPLQFASIDISLTMIPLIIFGLRRGLLPALSAGFLCGLLKLLTGFTQILSPMQGFMEYILAFTFAGFAGLFYHQFQKAKHPDSIIIIASVVACLTRFFWHFIAGVVFWGEYAPKGMNPWLYSLIVNGASALLTALVACIVCVLLYHINKKIFIPNK